MTPLCQRMINDMNVRGLARSTMASYLHSVTRLARHYRRSPDRISAREVQDCLLFLQQRQGLNRTTCNTIRHGVRFFYRITLDRPDPHFYVPGAKVPSTLPQILNRDELVRLFTVTTDFRHRGGCVPANSGDCSSPMSTPPACVCASTRARATRTATSRSRPGCWSCCASTGAIAGLSAGCSPHHLPTAR